MGVKVKASPGQAGSRLGRWQWEWDAGWQELVLLFCDGHLLFLPTQHLVCLLLPQMLAFLQKITLCTAPSNPQRLRQMSKRHSHLESWRLAQENANMLGLLLELPREGSQGSR